MDEHRQRFRTNFRRVGGQPAQPAAAAHATQPQTAQVHQPKAKKVGFFAGRRWLLIVIAILVLAIAGLAYGYVHTKNQLNAAKNPTTAGKTEAEQIENTVNKYVQLPTSETPTLATVSDVSKLKSQTFFKDAQNGDKVLIYTKAGTALLYRPSTKKVIEYAPVNAGNNQ